MKDEIEALKWYSKAAEQNDIQGQYNLGVCYANGEGVPKDYVEAYTWYNLAAKTDGNAAQRLNFLAGKMSPEQIIDGYKRTKELRAQIEARVQSAAKSQPTVP